MNVSKPWETVPLSQIQIKDPYWNRYTNLIPEKVLPYQWEILNDRVPDALPSRCLRNFRIAVGDEQGKREGAVFQDSDAAKWLEAVAYSLASRPDPLLESQADEVIDLIGRAQQPDGYLNTYFTLVEPENRWKNLSEGHELYCAGHLMEAGTAYFQTTGKRKLLEICVRLADLICETFGPEEGQCRGYSGHPEIELALVKMYRATGDRKYLDKAAYFLDIRGQSPEYLSKEQSGPEFRHIFPEFSAFTPEYAQAHKPVREQDTAEGHAVRACYLYSAMADVAAETGDEALLNQCKVLWDNLVKKRMYVTGSIGSSGFLERFTSDYDLPNDCNYSETCASIALAMFGIRMAAAARDASYVDIVERALCNTVRAGIAMTGDRYFYVNPLEVSPELRLDGTSRAHVKPVRQKWFDVACCPTNVARTFTSLGNYIYGVDGGSLYVNLFVQNETEVLLDGHKCRLRLCTDFPRTGNAALTVRGGGIRDLFLRVPDYAGHYRVSVNGGPAEGEIERGYFHLRDVSDGDEISILFTLTARFVLGNPLVKADCGKAALLRGPEVYCLETADQPGPLAGIYVDPRVEITETWEPELLGGTVSLSFDAWFQTAPGVEDSVCSAEALRWEKRRVKAVPYGSWGNRGPGEMVTWLHAVQTDGPFNA